MEYQTITLVTKERSKVDKTIKYVFKLHDGLIMETTYIDNNTGKDIICVATQTLCGMGCTFCHLTDYIGIFKNRNITDLEITDSVKYICGDLNIDAEERTLLISYMGCGEPLLNPNNAYNSMLMLKNVYKNIRFGLATSLPKHRWTVLFNIAELVKLNHIPLKIHLSLHYTNDIQRNAEMPNALDIKASIAALEFYKQITGNSVEIHYTLIKGANDSQDDMWELEDLLQHRGIPIKFLRFNSKETNHNEGAELEKIEEFRTDLEAHGIKTEYYEPPGKDVGASCGQFLFDQYELIKK